jgi:hypothetical protein
MVSLDGYPFIDKDSLIGGCARLRLSVDLQKLTDEVLSLPADLWGSRGGRVGVHRPAEAIFLRGYAPAEGDKPIVDRESLQLLPYVRHIIEDMIPAPPMRCLLAKLRPGGIIAAHRDHGDYFSKTIRIHVPIITAPSVIMHCRGYDYHMKGGEVWALNNSNMHAVLSEWDQPRTHVICDFLPTDSLLRMLNESERDLGVANQETIRRTAPVQIGRQQ